MSSASSLLARVWRSGHVESVHRGAVAVVVDGRLQRAFGDAQQPVFARSAIKPLQALPLLESGAADRFGVGDRELALVCASHGGTPEQVEVVLGLLARGAFTAADLRCGPHAPLDRAAALALARAGDAPGPEHNNCSGKHAGFLLLSRALGAAPAGYLDPDGPTQALVRAAVAEMAGVAAADVGVGLDGCGAPTLRLPLAALAHAFWRLANPAGLPAVRVAACRRLLRAVTGHPALFAGSGRLCTALIGSAPGRLLPKNGAEGVYAVGVAAEQPGPGGGFGLAVKVADGHERGYKPVVVEALRALGVWREVPPELADFHRVPLRNTQNALVGFIDSALAW